MKAHDVIKRPVITEKSVLEMDNKKYTFEVDKRANKTQIKYAIEEIFDVEVEKVNTQITKRKPKRMGMHSGYTKNYKKAIVKLTDASNDIQIFSEDNEDEE